MRTGRAAAAVAVVLATGSAAAACGSSSGGPAAVGHSSSPPPVTVRLSDRENREVVRVHTGDRLVVTLHSTYWQLASPRGPVLSALGRPSAAPGRRTGPTPCPTIPGTGCGTVTGTYRVTAPGRVTLTANRSSCGEAMRCIGRNGMWSVTVVATGAAVS